MVMSRLPPLPPSRAATEGQWSFCKLQFRDQPYWWEDPKPSLQRVLRYSGPAADVDALRRSFASMSLSELRKELSGAGISTDTLGLFGARRHAALQRRFEDALASVAVVGSEVGQEVNDVGGLRRRVRK